MTILVSSSHPSVQCGQLEDVASRRTDGIIPLTSDLLITSISLYLAVPFLDATF